MASIATYIVIFVMVYYTIYILKLIIPTKRKEVKKKNKTLDKMRTISVKTLDEQKKFIDVKFGNVSTKKKKITWKKVGSILLHIVFFVGFMRLYLMVFNHFNINIKIYIAIILLILGPLMMNLILKQFKVQKGDISVFFRRSK